MRISYNFGINKKRFAYDIKKDVKLCVSELTIEFYALQKFTTK